MNRQHFTSSLRINFSQISLFLYSHFSGLGPGVAQTQYLAPDALLRSTFALSLYHWSTHNTLCRSLPPVPSLISPRMILFSLSLVLYGAVCRFWTHPEGNGSASNIHYRSCGARTVWNTLSLSLKVTSEQKLWVSGFAGSCTARGCQLMLEYKKQHYI
jgi:hypothetical protein